MAQVPASSVLHVSSGAAGQLRREADAGLQAPAGAYDATPATSSWSSGIKVAGGGVASTAASSSARVAWLRHEAGSASRASSGSAAHLDDTGTATTRAGTQARAHRLHPGAWTSSRGGDGEHGFAAGDAAGHEYEQFARDDGGNGAATTLKEQEAVIQRLQKHNFNLMLRIYYLEERLAQLTGGDGEGAGAAGEVELQEQVVELKVLIEERNQELEERNVLLVKARNAIESLQADLEFARIQATEIQRAGPSLQEVAERERVVGELKQTIRSYESRERSSHLKMESMRAQIESLQQTVSHKDAELARQQTLESQLAAKSTELAAALSSMDLLREEVKAKSALEDRVHARELELVSQGEELDKLRHDVVRLSQELGQQRGRADALSSQARSVARLEAEEIARLEEQVASLRQVLDRERQLSGAMKEELERNAELLSNTDKVAKAMEHDVQSREGALTEAQRVEKQLRATLREREAALGQRLKDAVAREGDLQARLVQAGEREAALMRKASDSAKRLGHVEAERDAECARAREAQEQLSDARRRLEEVQDANRRLSDKCVALQEESRADVKRSAHEMSQTRAAMQAEAERRVQAAETEANQLRSQLESQRREFERREADLTQQRDHWVQHIRGTLGDFLVSTPQLVPGGRGATATTAGAAAAGGGDVDRAVVMETLRRLPSLRRWFINAVSEVEQRWTGQLSLLVRRCAAAESRVAHAERAVTPAAIAARALASQTQDAEARASRAAAHASERDQELEQMRAELVRMQRAVHAAQAAVSEVEARAASLEANNKVLIMELDEKRSLAEASRRAQLSAQREKLAVITATEALKRDMQSRSDDMKRLEQELLRSSHDPGVNNATARDVLRRSSAAFHQSLRAVSDGVSRPAASGQHSGDAVGAQRQLLEELQVHTDRVAELLRDSERLVSASSEIVNRFLTYQQSLPATSGRTPAHHGRPGPVALHDATTPAPPWLSTMVADVRSSLDSAARVSLRLQQVASDLRKVYERVTGMMTHSTSSGKRSHSQPSVHSDARSTSAGAIGLGASSAALTQAGLSHSWLQDAAGQPHTTNGSDSSLGRSRSEPQAQQRGTADTAERGGVARSSALLAAARSSTMSAATVVGRSHVSHSHAQGMSRSVRTASAQVAGFQPAATAQDRSGSDRDAGSRRRRVELLHRDMVARLSRIGVDLQHVAPA